MRYGTMRPRRPRGDLVKRNEQATRYSFPSTSSQEVWVRHGEAVNAPAPLNDPRIAKLPGVTPGTEVLRRFRVTGPASEAPFQINISWIHPRVADIVADVDANPAAGEWLYRIEKAGHWPISWMEFHRARMPSKDGQAARHPDQPARPRDRPGGHVRRDDKPVEVTEYVVASDRVETVHILHRDENARDPWPDDDTLAGQA